MKKKIIVGVLSLISLVACNSGGSSFDYDGYAKEIADITNATMAKSDSFTLKGTGNFSSFNLSCDIITYFASSFAFTDLVFSSELTTKNMHSSDGSKKEVHFNTSNIKSDLNVSINASKGKIFPDGLDLKKTYDLDLKKTDMYISSNSLYMDFSDSSIAGDQGIITTILNDLFPSSPSEVIKYQNWILGEKTKEEQVLGKRTFDPNGASQKELTELLKYPLPSKIEEMAENYTTNLFINDTKALLTSFVNEHHGSIDKKTNEDGSYQYSSSLDCTTFNTLIKNFTDIKQNIFTLGTTNLLLKMDKNNVINSINLTFNNVYGVYYQYVQFESEGRKIDVFIPFNLNNLNGSYTLSLSDGPSTIEGPGNTSSYIVISEE